MNTNDPMPQEQLDAIRERLDRVEFPDNEHLTVMEGEEPTVAWVECSPRDGSIISGGPVATVHAGPRSAEMFAHAPQDLTALLAEVERLRALTTVDDDMVERAARAFYEYLAPGVDVSLRPNWGKLAAASPDIADSYRAGVRAALEAVFNTQEGTA